mmetsp:Transcript_83501/g.186392  ORF Transcript_83501/g.186392 Transcript_83501/m.186392 type:complete len:201 (+) Transcript_83501:330-932(+)
MELDGLPPDDVLVRDALGAVDIVLLLEVLCRLRGSPGLLVVVGRRLQLQHLRCLEHLLGEGQVRSGALRPLHRRLGVTFLSGEHAHALDVGGQVVLLVLNPSIILWLRAQEDCAPSRIHVAARDVAEVLAQAEDHAGTIVLKPGVVDEIVAALRMLRRRSVQVDCTLHQRDRATGRRLPIAECDRHQKSDNRGHRSDKAQ